MDSHLMGKGILTKEQRDTLNSVNHSETRKRKIFRDIILDFKKESCEKFLDCLKCTSTYAPHEQLYRKLLAAFSKLSNCKKQYDIYLQFLQYVYM